MTPLLFSPGIKGRALNQSQVLNMAQLATAPSWLAIHTAMLAHHRQGDESSKPAASGSTQGRHETVRKSQPQGRNILLFLTLFALLLNPLHVQSSAIIILSNIAYYHIHDCSN